MCFACISMLPDTLFISSCSRSIGRISANQIRFEARVGGKIPHAQRVPSAENKHLVFYVGGYFWRNNQGELQAVHQHNSTMYIYSVYSMLQCSVYYVCTCK